MVNVVVQSGGIQGQRGPGWQSGAGAPTANQVGTIDGDLYFDTTNVGYYYGPRSNGAWGTPKPFGNSLNGVPLSNTTATTNPVVGNDNTQGYSRGSYWVNTTTSNLFVCTNAATGAAVWVQTSPANSPAPGYFYGASSSSQGSWTVPNSMATGLLSGGVLSLVNSSTFAVSAGTGQIVDFTTNPAAPTITPVTIAAQNITLTAQQLAGNPAPVLWWIVNSAGVLSPTTGQPTAAQYRSNIVLGGTVVSGGVLALVNPVPSYLGQPMNQMWDLMTALGSFSVSGNVISANGANLSMAFANGQLWNPGFNYPVNPNSPHLVTTATEALVNFYYTTRVANSSVAGNTVLNPTVYDVNGTLTSVPGGTGTSTIQRVFLAGTRTAGTQLIVQYGQNTYGTLAAAVSAVNTEPFVVSPNLVYLAPIYAICISKSCASLQDTTTSAIVNLGKFAPL